jgi:hypothetical protein
MTARKGPLVLAELYNQNGEHAFSLTAISKRIFVHRRFQYPGRQITVVKRSGLRMESVSYQAYLVSG